MAFAVFPAEFVVPGLFAIDFENEFAAAWIKIKIASDDEVAGETIAAGLLRFELGGDFNGFIDRHAIGRGRAFGIVKLFAGDGCFIDDFGDGGHSGGNDFFRGLHVFFQQQRRDAEHIGDGVKTIAGVIRREFFGGVEIDSHQIADGVAIFDAIETVKGDAAWIRIGGIDGERGVFDPVGELRFFGFGGLGLFLRGHDAGADIFQDFPPSLAILGVGGELINGEFAFLCAFAVAVVAVFGEEGLNVFWGVRGGGGGKLGGDQEEYGEDEPMEDLLSG